MCCSNAFYSKFKSSTGDKQKFYVNLAASFYRILIRHLESILEDEFGTMAASLAQRFYFTETSRGSPIEDDKSEEFALFQIMQRSMLHLADVERHLLSISNLASDVVAVSRVVDKYKSAMNMRCTHGISLLVFYPLKEECKVSWQSCVELCNQTTLALCIGTA